MSSALIAIAISLTKVTTNLPAANAAFAGTSVVVTDSTGVAQPAVVLTGAEATPWEFTTSVNPGNGTVTATDLDVNGDPIGSPVTQTFTEAGSPPPATYPATSTITVTPVVAAASTTAAKA